MSYMLSIAGGGGGSGGGGSKGQEKIIFNETKYFITKTVLVGGGGGGQSVDYPFFVIRCHKYLHSQKRMKEKLVRMLDPFWRTHEKSGKYYNFP